MLAFGAGIVPARLITGMVSSYGGGKLRSVANRIAALTIILMGAVMIMRGAGISIPLIGPMHEGHRSMQKMEDHPHHQVNRSCISSIR